MAIRRYTESQNIRFEVHIVELLDEASRISADMMKVLNNEITKMKN